MLDNVSAKTVAGRELEAMTSSSKATLVAKLDKTLNANVNIGECEAKSLVASMSL